MPYTWWADYPWAIGLFLGGLVIATLARILIVKLAGYVLRLIGMPNADRRFVSSFAWIVPAAIVVGSTYLALNRIIDDRTYRWWLNNSTTALYIILAGLLVSRAVHAGMAGYIKRLPIGVPAAGYMNLVRKILQVIVALIALLLLLNVFNYRFTTVLAGLGLASLAVGLALQDTIANFFAGLWLIVDHPISRGDYLRIETGHEGWVTDIGWRYSKLQTWDDNLLVVPNNRIAASILVNNSANLQTTLFIQCRAAYGNDLELVEDTARAAAREAIQRVAGTIKDYEPLVLFRSFENFNIHFSVGMRVRQQLALRELRSVFIKTLQRHFEQAGITINIPTWPPSPDRDNPPPSEIPEVTTGLDQLLR